MNKHIINTVVLASLASCSENTPAFARPNQQWADVSSERREFFGAAKMPDSPRQSCCGEADAYEADDYEVDANGNLVAILTCNEPDVIDGIDGRGIQRGHCSIQEEKSVDDGEGGLAVRPARPPGTKIVIPMGKILRPNEPINKTGHGWVFMSGDGHVFCYTWGSGQ
jgi:hypothetical protein